MKHLFYIILASVLGLSQAQAKGLAIPKGFTQEKVKVGDVTINVYKGGKGDPLVLLHGFAQSALMWTPVMNEFKDRFTIIAPDLRGAGYSSAPDGGYDKVTMAEDIKAVMDHYQITRAKVVGHDIGLMVAYALAAKHPDMVERLVLMDAFLPGVGPGDDIYNSPDIWHFRFHGPYAEALVTGRERTWLNAVWDAFSARKGSFPESHKDYYVTQYKQPGHVKAGMAYFTAFPQDAKDNREFAKTKLTMPVMTIGGAKSMGTPLAATAHAAASSVDEKVIADCGHWLLEECTAETVKNLSGFLTGATTKMVVR